MAKVATFTSNVLAYASAANANFNNPSLAFSSNPRVIQVLARFNWQLTVFSWRAHSP